MREFWVGSASTPGSARVLAPLAPQAAPSLASTLICAAARRANRNIYPPSRGILFQWAANIVYDECVCSECLTDCVKKLPPNRQFTEIVCFRPSPAHLHTIPCDPRMRQCEP